MQDRKTTAGAAQPHAAIQQNTISKDSDTINRLRAIIKRKEGTYVDRITQKYKNSPEKLNKFINRIKAAIRNTELCLINYKVNRQNLSDNRITDTTLEAIVDHVFELFFAINLRVNLKAYNRVYVLTGLSKDRDPNVFEIYPHWTLLYGIYHPYIQRVYFEEIRNEETGELLYVKCTIIDKQGHEYTHTASGNDIKKYHEWPDKCTMLKKHALRQALSFTFPLVLAKFGIETYVTEDPDEINAQYVKTDTNNNKTNPLTAHSVTSTPVSRQEQNSVNATLKSKVKTIYDELVKLAGPEYATQVVQDYKRSKNIVNEWTDDSLIGLITHIEAAIQELSSRETHEEEQE